MNSEEPIGRGAITTNERRSIPPETRQLLERIAPVVGRALSASTAVLSLSRAGRAGAWSSWYGELTSVNQAKLLNEFARHSSGDKRRGVVAMVDVRQDTSEVSTAALLEARIMAFVAAPILDDAGKRIGLLAVADDAPRQWQTSDVETLTELAALAGRIAAMRAGDVDATLARLRRSFDDGLAGHAVATPEGAILACNPEFARIAGFASVEEALAANIHALEPEPGAFHSLLERLKHSPVIPLEELRFVRRDGSPSHVLARIAATLDTDGKVTEVRVYLLDITQRFLIEQQLRESAERLRLIELATQDVLWDWHLTTGRLNWNDAIARRFRYTLTEVRSTIDWHLECIHPDDRERVVRSIERAILGVETSWSDEYRFLRGDGSYAMVLDRAHIVRNGRGEPERVVGCILDITELKESEASQRFLARASESLESVLEVDATANALARLGVPSFADFCLVDLIEPDGALRRAAVAHAQPGCERFLGFGAVMPAHADAPLAPRNAVRTAAPEVLASGGVDAISRLGVAQETGVRAYMTVPIVARERVLGAATFGFTDGRRHFSPLDLMTAKDLAHRAGLAVDNAILYETAKRAVLNRNEVLGVVSHDLRVPVNTMMATLSLLADGMRERREDARKWFDILCRAASQMKTLIDDLLDASRLEARQFAVDRSTGSASAIISEACDMLRPLATASGVAMETDFADDLPQISVDGPKIVRVVANLLGNAIKFSRRGGNILVHAELHQNEIRVSVADEGDGIPADQLDKVFNRFWSGRTGDRRGAGLGLTIAKGIVEAHGGRIWVESKENSGSVFTFSIPLGDSLPAEPPLPQSGEAGERAAGAAAA